MVRYRAIEIVKNLTQTINNMSDSNFKGNGLLTNNSLQVDVKASKRKLKKKREYLCTKYNINLKEYDIHS